MAIIKEFVKLKTTFVYSMALNLFPMVTNSSKHCENIVNAIRHINKEKLYLDSIK
jgi:hypothetical protein